MSYSPYFLNQSSSGSSRSTVANFQNGSGAILQKATVVSVNTSSQLVKADINSENLIQAIVGITSIQIPNGAIGSVIDNGRLEDITISFSIGDAVYVNFDGTLTNIKPDLSIAGFTNGMFCVFVGVVVKNEFNSSLKDLKLMISVIGQL